MSWNSLETFREAPSIPSIPATSRSWPESHGNQSHQNKNQSNDGPARSNHGTRLALLM